MLKKIISYIISFLLVIFITILILFQAMNTTVLNRKYIENKINNSNYYAKLSEKINNNFKNNIMQSGMEEKIFDNIYTEETLKNDFSKILDAIYENKEISIDTTEIKNRLDENIEQYIKESKIKKTDRDKQQIEIFEETIIQNYVSSVYYSISSINVLSNIVKTSNTYFKTAFQISIIATIMLIVLLVLLNYKNKKIVLSYLGTSLIAVGGIIITILLFERLNIDLEHSIINDECLSILVRIFSTNLIEILYKASIGCFLVGLIFLII